MSTFCMGNLSIHRTVHEFIFAEQRLTKLCAQMDTALLDDEMTQGIAFYFRLWHCDPVFQAQVFDCTTSEEYETKYGVPALTGIFQSLMSELRYSEGPLSTHPLSATWLPLIELRLRQVFPTLEAYEAFLDDSVIHDYISLERFAEDPGISQWHTDILCIAVKFKLFSYVRAHLHNDNINKPGRPLLHYAISRGFGDPMDMLALLFSSGCRPETEFNFRTTWEFVLIASSTMYDRLGMNWRMAEVIPMFLKHGADPNQQVDMYDYQCFALHVMFATDHLDYKILETVLQDMLDRGADVNAIDSMGRSVIDSARENRPEAVSLLRAYSSTSRPPPVLNNRNAMYQKIASANGMSNMSETLLLAVKEQEGRYEEFLERRPLRITDGRWTVESNVSASVSNAAVQISNVFSDNGGIARRPSFDEQDGNDKGFFEADAPVLTGPTLTAELEGCRISDLN
ncbi:hypothetical protein DL98DRAFT_113643 [Cadophora sp. DSE1049]|nr:hypothetical protein DL98DRAFT_113643 [Cadophora sp. DSE1049]